jgi:hypothetical protein
LGLPETVHVKNGIRDVIEADRESSEKYRYQTPVSPFHSGFSLFKLA